MRIAVPSPSLAARVMLGAAVLVVVCAIALVHLIAERDREAYLADRGAALTNRGRQAAARLGLSIDSLRRNVLILARLPAIPGVLRAARNRGMDPERRVPIEFWIGLVQEVFSAFAEANPDYFQIRYVGVGANGRELVRVEVAGGRATVTPPEKLQSKGDRDYFQATLKLRPGEVYVSEINLNEEFGGIQVPHVRTLRAATPVFTHDGELFGMVVINLDIGTAIDAVTANLAPGIQGYLVNSTGDYLAHPDPGRTFGFNRGQRYTWQQDMPGLQVPSSPDAGRRSLQALSTREGLLHLAVERVQLDPRAPERFLLLAYALPDAQVAALAAEVRNTAAAGVAGIALLILGGVILFVHRAFAPLARLTASAHTIGEGRYDVALPEATGGEMRVLVEAFARMKDSVAARELAIREANDVVRRSEARLQTVVESLAEGVAVSDLEGRLLHFNRAAIRMHGFTGPEEYLRRLPEFVDTFELSAPDGTLWPVEQWPLGRILRGERLQDLEVHIRRKRNGWQRVFSYGGDLARDADGRPLMAIVTIRDVTERREAARRIQSQVEHLTLLDHITRATGERQDLHSIFQVVVGSLEDRLPIDFGCVCLHDPAANTLRVSCVGAKSATLARDLMMDERAPIEVDANGLAHCVQGQLVYESDIGLATLPFPRRLARGGLRSLVMAPLRSESRVFGVLVAARRAAQGFSSVECEFLRQLSEHVALAAGQAQLYGALQQAYDDLRQSQQAVMQQERLRALGQLASGIAHDINNALSPVALYTESLLETEPGLSDRARGYLETTQRAVEDVANTVARMREFYRSREPELTLVPVDANRLVQQVLDLTRPRWSDMAQQHGIVIRASTSLAPDLPKFPGVESEIREALTNLVLNAVDALPEGGTMTLCTRLAEAANEHQARAVVIEVTDDGAGMDEDIRRRCLEPFFTTKGERGTGLGLAMVYGIAERHGARLEVDSAPGAGTTIRLAFDLPAEAASPSGQAVEALDVPSRLRLLLIDDDPILRKSLQDILAADGHVAVAAAGGQEGIDAFRASLEGGERFAAVITDLGMPYVDGRKVAAAVKEASPATPVILLTGWGQRLVADGEIPAHADRVLAKPPKLRELRQALAQLCPAPGP